MTEETGSQALLDQALIEEATKRIWLHFTGLMNLGNDPWRRLYAPAHRFQKVFDLGPGQLDLFRIERRLDSARQPVQDRP